jgi:hypothetical protein
MRELSISGKIARLTAVVGVLGITLVGTIHGQDSWFPFGPFRMYSTRDSTHAPVKSTLMQGITDTGKQITISGVETGLRRAEVEGQLGRFEHNPQLLETIADAYQQRHSGTRLAAIEIVTRDYGLKNGVATGHYTQTLQTRWSRK